jgi:hypothetical protein
MIRLGRRELVFLGAILAAAHALPASAQGTRIAATPPYYVAGSMGIPQPEPKVTVQVQNKTLSRAVFEVFKTTGYQPQVLADVGATLVSLDVKNMPMTQALNQILAQDKSPEPLVYSFRKNPTGVGGTFMIDREYIEIGRIEGENKVSIANARITKVLPEIFKMMKVPYRIEPDVPPVTVSLQLRPNDWSSALPTIILEAFKREPTLTYSRDGDTYVVHLHKTPTGTGIYSGTPTSYLRPTKLSITDKPLRDALAELFTGSKWKYEVAASVKDVPLTFSVVMEPELAVLSQLLKAASEAGGEQLTYREGKGVLYIEPGPLPGEAKVESKSKDLRPVEIMTTRKLKDMIILIANISGATINVSPNVPDIPVTLKVKNARVDVVLKMLVDSVKTSIPNLTLKTIAPDNFYLELK